MSNYLNGKKNYWNVLLKQTAKFKANTIWEHTLWQVENYKRLFSSCIVIKDILSERGSMTILVEM